MNSIQLRALIRSKYAWPGGYPMYGICSDGGSLCMECMRKEYRQIAYARKHNLRDGWRVDAVDINYEDNALHCDHCNVAIQSAYGDPSETRQDALQGENTVSA